MDEIVKQAMTKWPNVPAVYGWLGLDRRGRWLIRDERISNPLINEFINRNYAHDEQGRWFFQNGPQKVYVTLACTPFVYRVVGASEGRERCLLTHTGAEAHAVLDAHMDDTGSLVLNCDVGVGVVDDRDLDLITPMLTDAEGRPVDEDALGKALDALQGGSSPPLYLHYRDSVTRVSAIRTRSLAGTYRFVAEPTDMDVQI